MQLKFALKPDDYLNILRDYYKNTDEGRKNWRRAQYKMAIPILILTGIFYFLHRDLYSVALLVLISVAVLFIQPPKFVVRRYQKRLMKEDYADKFKETLYRFNENGIETFNKEKRERMEWKDLKIFRKTGAYIWLKIRSDSFLIFPKKEFDPGEDYDKLYDYIEKSVTVNGIKSE